MKTPSSRRFLESLPLRLARWSKAILVALKRQAIDTAKAVKRFVNSVIDVCVKLIKKLIENLTRFIKWIGNIFVRVTKWLWSTYYKIETQLLVTAVDIALTLIALRVFILLVIIGVVLAYLKHWVLLILYLAFIGIALYRYFKSGDDDPNQEEHHKKSRLQLVKLFRIPVRIAISITVIVMVYSLGFTPFRDVMSYISSIKQNRGAPITTPPVPTTQPQPIAQAEHIRSFSQVDQIQPQLIAKEELEVEPELAQPVFDTIYLTGC